MRIRLTVILILLNVTLLLAIYMMTRSATTEADWELNNRMMVSPLLVDQATHLKFHSSSANMSWEVVKENGDWKIVSPVEWSANVFAVTRILDQLKRLRWENRFRIDELEAVNQSLSTYGLDRPIADLELVDQGIRIYFGNSTEIGDRIYTTDANSTYVHVIDQSFLKTVSIPLLELRNQEIFAIPAFEIRSISIQNSESNGVRVRLSCREKEWNFDAPIRTSGDALVIQSAISKLLSTQCRDFMRLDAEQQGLINPVLQITLEGNARRQTLLVGAKVAGSLRYARMDNSETVFLIPEEPLQPFMNAQESLRNRYLCNFNTDEVSAVEITATPLTTPLQKLENGQWQVVGRTAENAFITWPADNELMTQLVNDFKLLKIKSFVSDAPSEADIESYGLNKPARILRIRTAEGEQTIHIGSVTTQNNWVYAKTSAEPFVYAIESYILQKTPISALHYRMRLINDIPTSARIIKIQFSNWPDKTDLGTYVLSGTNASSARTWKPEGTVATVAMIEPLNELRPFLRQFKVGSYMLDHYTDELVLDPNLTIQWAYQCQMTIELPATNGVQIQEQTFLFSKRTGGTTQFGTSPTFNVTFTLRPECIELLAPFLNPQ
jgi:hypothetical protein